jgi:hypothetical protein
LYVLPDTPGVKVVTCTCGRIRIGLRVTEHRNWNPDCPEHGTETDFWKSREQIEDDRP